MLVAFMRPGLLLLGSCTRCQRLVLGNSRSQCQAQSNKKLDWLFALFFATRRIRLTLCRLDQGWWQFHASCPLWATCEQSQMLWAKARPIVVSILFELLTPLLLYRGSLLILSWVFQIAPRLPKCLLVTPISKEMHQVSNRRSGNMRPTRLCYCKTGHRCVVSQCLAVSRQFDAHADFVYTEDVPMEQSLYVKLSIPDATVHESTAEKI
jgi:hypothetical protein